jgi:hypothetical protein
MAGPTRFGFVVPLGEWCIVASQLKRRGLRTCALPYDWCFANIDAVTADGVRLDSAKDSVYVKDPPEEWPTYPGHPKQVHFAHHDVRLQDTREYLRRCYERLLWILGQEEAPVLFVHACVDRSKRSPEKLCALRDIIRARYPQLTFEILSIQESAATAPASSVSIHREEADVVYADVSTVVPWSGDHWEGNHDAKLWDEILNHFDIAVQSPPSELFSKDR